MISLNEQLNNEFINSIFFILPEKEIVYKLKDSTIINNKQFNYVRPCYLSKFLFENLKKK